MHLGTRCLDDIPQSLFVIGWGKLFFTQKKRKKNVTADLVFHEPKNEFFFFMYRKKDICLCSTCKKFWIDDIDNIIDIHPCKNALLVYNYIIIVTTTTLTTKQLTTQNVTFKFPRDKISTDLIQYLKNKGFNQGVWVPTTLHNPPSILNVNYKFFTKQPIFYCYPCFEYSFNHAPWILMYIYNNKI